MFRFYLIAESEHIDTYCYYISQSTKETAVDWLKRMRKGYRFCQMVERRVGDKQHYTI